MTFINVSKIFVTRPIPEVGLKMLRDRGYEVVVNLRARDRAAEEKEMITGAKDASALLSLLTDKVTAKVMDAGLPTLKIIANYAVGFDNIDLDSAKQRNILVTNTPGVLTNAVAEHTFALILAIDHRIAEADRFSRAGKYKAWGAELLLGESLSGKVLGVVGLGRIGMRVACHAIRGFEMKVLYCDLKRDEDFEKEYAAAYVANIDELLPQCDFVSIHVPLLDSTRHLFNGERFKKMRPSAYLINTSRGPIVDEAALAAALSDGIIRGAAIDVFEFEPKITPELKKLENIIITPHIASATHETRDKMAELAARNIIDVLEGRMPPNIVS